MAATDGQRFTVIFILATLLICGTFGLYVTHAQDFFTGFGSKENKTSAVYENEDYGFYLIYPNSLTADATSCAPESKPCVIRFIDKNAKSVVDANTNQKSQPIDRTILTITIRNQRAVTHCDALNGRVEGGFTIGNTTYQPCIVPMSAQIATEGMHIETTLNDHTYTFAADDYYGDRAVLQAMLLTFQLTR